MYKKVFIDAGHGGSDPGAKGVNGSNEKDINLSVAKKVAELLKNQDLEIKLSRETDKTLTLQERCNMANDYEADCFISIHCNAFNSTAKGVESFSLNQNTSDLAICTLEGILNEKTYTLNRGVKFANFYVLKYTNMRACLIEIGFIDNKDDYKILTEKEYEIALGIAKGICKYLNVDYKQESETKIETEIETNIPVLDSETFYRVICGAFNNQIYAEERLEDLKKLGFDDAFIVAYNNEE